ncbi:Uncharacterized protein PECH_002534 [Penicillium ucsense]|uniref:Uncharacterized protein n=1 Tax=Penicillium ucsense TaxID=2839758 RepID=A0A8J8VXH2_9EURO|nr:Uncharacterized protein PECM_000880 [Penicillium ucsense]KAF7730789.1 Uncharacterized protein PECH_002534 [Penicillium ucsense]
MSAFDRVRRLVGLEGGIRRQEPSPATSSSSSAVESSGDGLQSRAQVSESRGRSPGVMTNPTRAGARTDSPSPTGVETACEQRLSASLPTVPLTLTSNLDWSGHDNDRDETETFLDEEQFVADNSPILPSPQHTLNSFLTEGYEVDPPLFVDADAANIEGSDPTSSSKAPFTRGHRRRSTHVTRRDLEKFQQEVLGVENTATWYDEENGSSRPIDPFDPQLEALNRAFEAADMSMSSGAGGLPAGNVPNSGLYTNYTENSPTPGMGSMSRRPSSPAHPHPGPQVNGGGPGAGGMPMNAGHQMDLHHLYEMVLELSEVLKNNREVTKSIVSSAEEIMKHGTSEDASTALRQVNGEITAARISELERALAKEKRLNEVLKHEQAENVKLIGDYETSVGLMVEQIRNYCQNNNMHYLYQKRHYNSLLQAERDAHLDSRLDRDYWHTQTMRCAQMIRTASRLRSEEEELPIRIVAGLQNEVRAYRNALGMEPEKPEQEYGWEILKDVPGLE